MYVYEDVLISTDGSDVASNAAAVGISIAQSVGATVHALAVADEERGDETDRREADAESIESEALEAGCAARSIVRSGRPATEVLACAAEIDADLIVVGTHGRTGIRQVALGSVALEVIRDARRPVLSIGPDAPERDVRNGIDDVVLATDGWSGSEVATEHALSIAQTLAARLYVLFAVDVDSNAREIREGFEEHGKRTLSAIAERASDRDLEVRRTIRRGPAHEIILEYTNDEDVELLVMGTEGKSTLERLVLGSVSQRVIPNASVPVTTARTLDS